MNIRGIDEKHEHAAQRLARDTRPLGERVSEFLSNPTTTFIISGTGASTVFIFPAITDLVFFICASLFIFAYTRKHVLPVRLPRSSKALDYNDLIPGTAIPKKAGGISFFANDRRSREEIWFTNDDLRTHVLIFGSTGSGKTEALVSIAFNSLVHGSGFIYIDGKGDNSLFAKVFSMTRSMGREDDLLLINFMTGARDVIGPQANRLSNTMNPFASGSSSMIAQLATSLMDDSGGGGNGDMWKGRAINFVESLMKVLCAMRDAGHVLLDASTIRGYFILEKLESIVVDKMFPVTDDYSVPIDGFPPQVLEPLDSYIKNLPGYNPKKKGNQAGEVREQHGFITMQLTRAFGSLADTYGHIIRTNLAEVDLKDVVLNRRILVVLLPALEKSPDELANLGKIIIASLKAMMAAGLGDSVEGDYRDVILRKPTNSPSPYVCIMDEYGYYAVKGFAVVPAQARSLGFSAIFAGQDLPAFQKASKEEAASIGANCNIKICMKLEDPQETWEFFNKVAGETYVTNVSGFQMNAGSMSMNYLDTKNASVDRRQRIELLDLKDQREGESHIFFKSKIVRAEMFYANPKPSQKMRINHFLKIEAPSDLELASLEKRLKQFAEVFADQAPSLPRIAHSEDIATLVDAFDNSDDLKPFERGIAALILVLEQEIEKQQKLSADYEVVDPEDEISCFTNVPISELTVKVIGEENLELFNLPLIRRGSTLEELKHIERLSGKSLQEAEKISNKLIKELEDITKYPPYSVDLTTNAREVSDDINYILEALGAAKIPYKDQNKSSKQKITKVTTGSELDDSEDDLDEFLEDLDTDDMELPDLPDLDSLQATMESTGDDDDDDDDIDLDDLDLDDDLDDEDDDSEQGASSLNDLDDIDKLLEELEDDDEDDDDD